MATILNQMKITPLSDALGAEVTGINAAKLDEQTFATLRDAYHDNIVLVIRDQHLTPAEQTDFAKRFGDIQYHINKEYLMAGQPEVLILSTEIKDGKNVGVPDAGSDWHSDHSYVDQPTGYTILQSVAVPNEGGDTEWTNMVTAYDTLSDVMKIRLDGLVGIHSFNRNKNHRMTRPTRHADEKTYFDDRSPPDAFHPIARTHPYTGRKALYISPRFTIGIKDMDDSEAQPLLDELFEHIANRALIYRHKWREGDLVMWDNRSTIHLALHGVKPPEIRRMHRTTVLGEIPF